jgi:hypothetical protein
MKVKTTYRSVIGTKGFGELNKNASELRRAFLTGIIDCYDNRAHQRLEKVIKVIVQNGVGSRRMIGSPADGDNKILEGFGWNKNVKLRDVFRAPFSVEADREEGMVTVTIPPFNAKELTSPNPEATHYRIVISSMEMSWSNMGARAEVRFSKWMRCDSEMTEEVKAIIGVRKNTGYPIYTCLAIKWAKEEGKMITCLKNLEYDTAEIVSVLTIKNEELRIKNEEAVMSYEL